MCAPVWIKPMLASGIFTCNQRLPQHESAPAQVKSPAGVSYHTGVRRLNSVSPPHQLLSSSQGITISAGLDRATLLDAITRAATMVWHAAIYNNFAGTEIECLIRSRLQSGALTRLDIISLRPHPQWGQEFARVLRPELSEHDTAALFAQSQQWCDDLAANFPEQVRHIRSHALPLQPILLLGDTLLAGQYAHSSLISAQGIWITLQAADMGLADGALWQRYLAAELPGNASAGASAIPAQPWQSPWPKALGRYVDECRQAAHMKCATESVSSPADKLWYS